MYILIKEKLENKNKEAKIRNTRIHTNHPESHSTEKTTTNMLTSILPCFLCI